MGWFDEDSSQAQAHNEITNTPQDHKPSWSHEFIAGAASYEAAKAYENHVAQNGEPQSHTKAKELLAGFAGAFIDREAETRGVSFIERERAKHEAKKHSEQLLSENNNQGW